MSRYVDIEPFENNPPFDNGDEYDTEVMAFNGGVVACQDFIDELPTADVQEIVRCKDCIFWQCPKVKMADGTLRDYTPEEVKEGYLVDISKGINICSQCKRDMYWQANPVAVFVNENDFCSYGKKADKE